MEKVLIVVDMLNDFCHPNGVLAKSMVTGKVYAAPIINNVVKLVEMFRGQNLPIIWLCDAHDKDDKEFYRFPAHAVRDTWGAQIIAELGPKYVERATNELQINKTRYSGFYGTDLEYQLSRLRWIQGDITQPTKAEVCGVCTSICVMDTVGGLLRWGLTRGCRVLITPGSGQWGDVLR